MLNIAFYIEPLVSHSFELITEAYYLHSYLVCSEITILQIYSELFANLFVESPNMPNKKGKNIYV